MAGTTSIQNFWAQLRRQYDPVPFLVASGHKVAARLRGRATHAQSLEGIREFERKLTSLTDTEITSHAGELRARVMKGRPTEEIIPEAFALASIAAARTLSMKPYDCQLLAGLVMCEGAIAEMATGEGKTLAAIFPAFVHALAGRGVHVATVNAYLATRDQEFTRPAFRMLGVSSALLPSQSPAARKQEAYAADITYGVGADFGFDYLRDQSSLLLQPRHRLGDALRAELLGESQARVSITQRGLAFAIIDEADSILIDEALTPLLLGGSKGEAPPELAAVYQHAHELAESLEQGSDYKVDATKKTIEIHDPGLDKIHDSSAVGWEHLQRPWVRYVENALRALHLFQRDVHYIVQKGKIAIVDEFTGRAFADRSWREGLHQAVEAKEKVQITTEGGSLASISRQRFYSLYSKVCGMSGTTMESAGELWRVYRTTVQPIPQNRPSRLQILPVRVFQTVAQKLDAVVAEITARHEKGQPVLVGARTIHTSEQLAARLDAIGLPYRLLNAKQDQEEAEIISEAGKEKAITLATNMAGRGAHIGLGAGVAEKGGLHVIGLEYHESRRVDRQLLGRSGRQGEAGSAQMLVSAEDYLLAHYAPDQSRQLSGMAVGVDGELPPDTARIFEAVQMEVEKQLYHRRSMVMVHDRWMEQTRERL